jgi:small conductance mechanosensitive channel
LKEDKKVEFFYTAFGDSSINFVVRYWVNYGRQPDYFRAISDGIKNLKKTYNENDITIPFPIRTLDFGIKGGEKLDSMLSSNNISKKN